MVKNVALKKKINIHRKVEGEKTRGRPNNFLQEKKERKNLTIDIPEAESILL